MTAVLGLLWPIARRSWCFAALVVASLLAWHFDSRAVANAAAMQSQAAAFKQAQAAATQIASAALDHQQAVYAARAMEADNAYKSQLADARGAADRYIAHHSVPAAAVASHAGAAATSAESGDPTVPGGLPTDAVVVSASDVRACTDATTYALKAHDWAAAINP